MNHDDPLAELIRLGRQVERGSTRTENGWARLQSSIAAGAAARAEIPGDRLPWPVRGGKWMRLTAIGTVGLIGAAGWVTLYPAAQHTAAATFRASTASAVAVAGLTSAPAAHPSTASPSVAEAPGSAVPPAPPAHTRPVSSAPAARTTISPSDSRTPAVAASSRNTFEQELRLINSARESLDHGQNSHAATLLHQHARLFPQGIFAGEREALRTIGACRTADAAQRAVLLAGFSRTYPRSPYVDRVKHACQTASEK